jgi:hypothetical protein
MGEFVERRFVLPQHQDEQGNRQRSQQDPEEAAHGPSAQIRATGARATEHRKASRQLRHNARTIVTAHSTPSRDFGKSAPAPDAERRDRIKRAHFVARALNAGHESPRNMVGQDTDVGAEGNRPWDSLLRVASRRLPAPRLAYLDDNLSAYSSV